MLQNPSAHPGTRGHSGTWGHGKPADHRRHPAGLSLLLLLFTGLAGLSGCSDSTDPGVDEALAFLVGTWDAESFVVTNPVDPTQSVDIVAAGSSFLLTVEPSGRYQASLSLLTTTSTVFGRLELDGNRITLFQEFPTEDTQEGTLEQLSQDRIRLSAETAFDFDQDGVPDPADFTAELVRTSG